MIVPDDSERLEERLIEIRQERCLHRLDHHLADGVPVARLFRVVSPDGDRERARLANRHATDGPIELLRRFVPTDDEREVLALAVVHHLAVDLDRIVDHHPVFGCRRSLHRIPLRALLAQRLHHVFDIRIADFGIRLPDLQRRQVDQFDFRQNLERRGELEIRAGIDVDQFHRRRPNQGQVFLPHGVLKARLHDLGSDLAAHGGAEPPLDFLQRNLAAAKPRYRDLDRRTLEAIGDAVLELRSGDRDGHFAGETACRLYGYLHIESWPEDRLSKQGWGG